MASTIIGRDAGAGHPPWRRSPVLMLTVALVVCGCAQDAPAGDARGRDASDASAIDIRAQVQACRIEGWVAERDPAGLNVRSAADRNAPILGKLPAYVPDGERRGFGIPVRITGAQNGWFRIAGAHDDPARSGQPVRPTFVGEGWVAANMLRFKLQSGRAHAEPAPSSRVLLDIGDDDVTEIGEIARVRDCVDDWVQVDLRVKARRDPKTDALRSLPPQAQVVIERAWLRGVCANQETTCDQRRP